MKTIVKKSDIDNAIADVCAQIIYEPMLYFSEADVQQMLVNTLKDVDSLIATVATSIPRGQGSKGKYRTQLVHREYGAGEGRRVDVVIFDPDDAAKINNTNLTIGRTYLKPLFAFEVGTEKTSDTATHLKNDLNKLRGIKGSGYIIHFFRDTTRAPTGSASRHRTEEKIEQSFRVAFNSVRAEIAANIRILAVLLRTGRKQARILGKCEIFDQQNGVWNKVNVKKSNQLKEAVRKQLA
jgi:hypothetical protein